MLNIIDSEVLEEFKGTLGSSISEGFRIANNEEKEVELTVKINIALDEDDIQKPKMEYKVVTKIKEEKTDITGSLRNAVLKFDSNGNPILVSEQMTLY